MRGLLLGIITLSGALVPSIALACDHVDLVMNLRWCYRNDHPQKVYIDSIGLSVTGGDSGTKVVPLLPIPKRSPSKSEYVKMIQEAAAGNNGTMLRDIYAICQRHHEPNRAGSPLKSLDSCPEPGSWVRAARHMVACFDHDSNHQDQRWGRTLQTPAGSVTCAPNW